MIGYRIDKNVLNDYPSFSAYELSTAIPFAIKHIAKLCGYRAWLVRSAVPSGQFDDCACVIYTPEMDSSNSDNIIIPHIAVDKDDFIGDIETTGYTDTAMEYLKYMFKSTVGSIHDPKIEPMFNNASFEQLCIDIDLTFIGDRREFKQFL